VGQVRQVGWERQEGDSGMNNNARVAAAWLGTPVCLVALWLLSDVLVSTAPGTALIFGVAALVGISVLIGLFFYTFRE
jgi:hypothetical protein